MSRPPRVVARKKYADDDEEAPSAASRTTTKKKPAAAVDDDAFPQFDFDMGDLTAELAAVEAEAAAPPRKARVPQRQMSSKVSSKVSSSRPSQAAASSSKESSTTSRPGSKAGSRRGSPERHHYTKMEELDRWRWSSKYSDEGDQDEIRLAQNTLAWQRVAVPEADSASVPETMMFRKFLWRNKKLCRDGIPPQHRLAVWEVLSGARTMPDRLEYHNRYQYYLSRTSQLTSKQVREIAQDVPRALQAHPKFVKSKEGQDELRQVLSAFAIRTPTVGYVNSLSHIAAYFLLYYQEEAAFWILCALVDIVLPADYFSQSLVGVRSDCFLLKLLVYQRFPKLHHHFAALGVDVASVALKWLMTLYFLCLPKECVARVLDVLFLEGSNILLSVGLSFFAVHEKELLEIDDLMEMLDAIGKLGNDETDNDELMRVIIKESKCRVGEEEDKRRQIERTIMENAYLKELQQSKQHRRLEEERRQQEAAARAEREREEEQAVALGIEVYKLGHYGDAKLTTVSLECVGGEWLVTWKSKRKKEAQATMKVSECSLHFGLRYGNFVARPEFQKKFLTAKKRSFSLVSDARTLDLVCQTSHDIDAFKKLFFRDGFPLRNSKSVLAHRRRIEKKKTVKRIKAAAAGKSMHARIESSSEDYDDSGEDILEEDEHDDPLTFNQNIGGSGGLFGPPPTSNTVTSKSLGVGSASSSSAAASRAPPPRKRFTLAAAASKRKSKQESEDEEQEEEEEED